MEREIRPNYKPSKKDLKLLSACEKIGLRVGAMIRKRSNGEYALQMDVRWPREKPLQLGHIILKKELAFEHIRLYRLYYAMIYHKKSIHYKKPAKVVQKPVMIVKKPKEKPKEETLTFSF